MQKERAKEVFSREKEKAKPKAKERDKTKERERMARRKERYRVHHQPQSRQQSTRSLCRLRRQLIPDIFLGIQSAWPVGEIYT